MKAENLNFENDDDRDPLTYRIIGAAIEVHRQMGPGLLESVCQSCLEEELRIQKIEVMAQHRIPLTYKGRSLADPLVIDFFFPGQLILEIKDAEKVLPVHEAQLISHMKLTKTQCGLLLNFHVETLRHGIYRRIMSAYVT